MDGHRNRLLGECGWNDIPSQSVMKRFISLCIPLTVEKKSFGNICRNVVPDAAHVMPGVVMGAAFRLN
jgi:hypothetical protein